MNLTSWNRLRYIIGGSAPLTDDWTRKASFIPWISVVSSNIEKFLCRNLELTTYTEYRDSDEARLEYWMRAYPITSITSVKSDSTGEFDGNETDESDYYIGKDSNSIVLETPVLTAKRGLQFIYTGGLASDPTKSVYVLSGEGATEFTVGSFAEGQTSVSLGLVTAKSGTSITIEVLFGKFQSDEVIKGKTAWDDTDYIANMRATIASVTSRCMVEAYPEITMTAEMEIRYMEDHLHNFENSSTNKDGTSRADIYGKTKYDLLPESKNNLQPYVYTVM